MAARDDLDFIIIENTRNAIRSVITYIRTKCSLRFRIHIPRLDFGSVLVSLRFHFVALAIISFYLVLTQFHVGLGKGNRKAIGRRRETGSARQLLSQPDRALARLRAQTHARTNARTHDTKRFPCCLTPESTKTDGFH